MENYPPGGLYILMYVAGKFVSRSGTFHMEHMELVVCVVVVCLIDEKNKNCNDFFLIVDHLTF